MRKITLGAVGALLLAAPVAGTAPAAAQEAAFVQWQSPEQDARLSGESIHIKAKVGYHGGVRGWAVEVLAPEGADYPGYGTICEKTESRSPAYVNVDCVWDTTAYPNDAGAAQNRPYVVRISANGQGPTPHSSDRAVVVSNPVSAPRDVRLAFSEPTKQATIRWAPNPEPDITSYVVQERIGDGPWKSVGQAGGQVTTFTRTLSAPGTYRYQVAALRAAGSGKDTIQSAWSGPGADPRQIVVAEPPRPTTTTTAPPPAAPGEAPPAPPAGPTDPGAPSPLTASGSVNDPAAQPPGSPAPAGGSDLSRSGAMISPIQAGSPGSVRSGGATVSAPALPGAAKPGNPAPIDESEGPDTGYSTELPYKTQDGATEDGGEVGRMLVGLPEAVGDEDARHLLVPLASGLLLFVFAMHVLYASRRAGAEAGATLETE
jgi:hypothetical protein